MACEVGQRLQGNVAQGTERSLIDPNGHMKCGAVGRADGVDQVVHASRSNTREHGSARDGVRGGEVEQGVQPFHTRVGMIALAQGVYQGQQQENIRAWTDGNMLTPALRAFRVTRVDPDDCATALLQAVENGTPSLQMHKTRLTDSGICPQEHGHIGMLEIWQRMDERTPMHDLRSGKLVLAILTPR